MKWWIDVLPSFSSCFSSHLGAILVPYQLIQKFPQMCRTGSTVGRCCRLGLFGNGERGSVSATGSVAGQPPLAVQPPRSARTGLQLENDCRTSNIQTPSAALEIRTEHHVWTFWSPLGLSCDIVSSPEEAETCDLARMNKTGDSTACDQMILQHPRWG